MLPALRPTPKVKDHQLSAVCGCLFNMFTTTLLDPCISKAKNETLQDFVQVKQNSGLKNRT